MTNHLDMASVLSRCHRVRTATRTESADPKQELDAGAVLAFAVFLKHERRQHEESIRAIDTELASLRATVPWLGDSLDEVTRCR